MIRLSRLTPLLAGLLFGCGLILSGMSNPAKVLAFLDIAGNWDPSLAVVMASAIAVATPAFWWSKWSRRAWSGEAVDIANRRPVDGRLLAGSALFGIGWGLSGLCPGPALIVAASGHAGALLFVVAMLAGMLLSGRIHSEGDA